MASERIVERRRVYQQYKADVKERGKPFFPFAMLHDTIMSLVVVCVITGLAIVWKYTTPGNHHSIEPGWLGRLYDAPADAGTINFVPRPDWYFYFLFYLLRVFKWPETVVIGTVGLCVGDVTLIFASRRVDDAADCPARYDIELLITRLSWRAAALCRSLSHGGQRPSPLPGRSG